MPTVIDSLLVTLGLDTRPYLKGIPVAQDAQRKLRDGVKKTSNDVGESLASLAKQAGALFLGFEGAKGALNYFAGLTVATANLGRFSTNVGVSAHEVNAWGQAVELAGGSASDAQGDLQGLSASLTNLKATGDVSPMLLLFQRLGVAIYDAQGGARKLTDIYSDLGDKLKQFNRADAYNLAKQGGLSDSTINLIMTEGKERARILALAEKTNRVNDDAVKKAQDLQQAWRGINQEVTGLGQEISGEIQPSVKGVLDNVRDLFAADGTQSGALGFFKALASSVNIVLDSLKTLKGFWGDGSFLDSIDVTLKNSWIGKTIGVLVNPLGSILNAGKADSEAAGAKLTAPTRGYHPASSGRVNSNTANNNPGNLRFAGQPGATQGANGFAAFPTLAEGIQAANRQLDLYANRGVNTISKIISKWAPASENDTAGYVAAVSKQLGKGADVELSPADRQRLLQAIFNKEGVNKVTGANISGALGGIPAASDAARFATQQSAPGSPANQSAGANGGRSTTVQIGQLNVHGVDTNNADAVAASLPDAMKRKGVVNQADSGMS